MIKSKKGFSKYPEKLNGERQKIAQKIHKNIFQILYEVGVAIHSTNVDGLSLPKEKMKYEVIQNEPARLIKLRKPSIKLHKPW